MERSWSGSSPISIVTAVWNKSPITARWLGDIKPLVERHNAEVIVVDNGSTDHTRDTLAYFLVHMPNLTIIPLNSNRGFGPANNLGIKAATSPNLLLMNNDVVVRGDFIALVIQALEQSPRALLGANLVNWDGGWNRFGNAIIHYCEAWFLAMGRTVWDELGGFDERFVPCDYEDVDLSYRASQADFVLENIVVPVRHIVGVSARQLPDRAAITQKNRKLFAEKWGLKL